VAVAATLFVAGAAVVSAQPEWKAPADAKAMKNPSPKDPKSIAEGKKLAETNCATCHGPEGKGNGPAAAALPPPKPADWTSAKVKSEPDGDIFWKIYNGREGMPPCKIVQTSDRCALVQNLR